MRLHRMYSRMVWLGIPIAYLLVGCNDIQQNGNSRLKAPISQVTRAENASGFRSGLPMADQTKAFNETVLKQVGRAIPNFHVVEPFLLRGAAPTPKGVQLLKTLGVKTVIDLRIAPKHVAAERKLVEAAGMRYINLPMSADPPTQKEIDAFLTTVKDPTQQPVYVHCQYGADRTGCMVGLYREVYEGWNYQKAYAEMRKYGFKPYLHKLAATVKSYQPGSQAAKAERQKVDALLASKESQP